MLAMHFLINQTNCDVNRNIFAVRIGWNWTGGGCALCVGTTATHSKLSETNGIKMTVCSDFNCMAGEGKGMWVIKRGFVGTINFKIGAISRNVSCIYWNLLWILGLWGDVDDIAGYGWCCGDNWVGEYGLCCSTERCCWLVKSISNK